MKIRNNNAVKCSPDFYDYYSIPFPVKSVGRIQKNKYLCSQLEKLHPCFSDDCCFDSRLKLSAHGLQADVVVMQKFRLAEYKSQNHHKPIYIEELKQIPFFRDYKIKTGIVIAAGVLALAAVFIGVFFKYRKEQVDEQTATVSVPADFYESSVTTTESDSFFEIKTFFETVALNNGKISDFSWKLNGFSQDYNITLKNIFPEQLLNVLPQITVSSVTYDKKVPLMSAQIKGSVNGSVILADDVVPVSEISSSYREFLFQKNITIIEETVQPHGIKARLPYDISLFKVLLEYFAQEELPLTSLSINVSKDGFLVFAGISKTRIKDQREFYECLLENAQVFFVQGESSLDDASALQKSLHKTVAKSSPGKGTVIGKILRTDGTAVEFYKDENGRIKQR